MSISVVERLSSSFTDTSLPKLYRDPVLNAGSKFLFDFTNAYCNPNADGNLAVSAPFNNLVDGASAGSVSVLGTPGSIASLTGKAGLSLSGAGGAAGTISLGTGYDLSGSNHEFIATLWLKMPASGYTTTSFQHMLFAGATGTNANTCQWLFDGGTGGVVPRADIGVTAAGNTAPYVGTFTPGSVVQFGLHWKPGSETELYVNGALNATSVGTVTSTLNSMSGAAILIDNATKATYYRAYQEDLALSGQTAAAAILADYTLNTGKFT